MSVAKALRPLEGVRILAWEQAVALPMATRLLANMGAIVVRLESHARSAPRVRHLQNDLIQNKQSVALDLTHEDARAIARRLVSTADVFCENFTPRVKRQFHLTYDDLKPLNPGLVMLSLSGYGQTGAWSDRPTYGPGIEAAAGQALSGGYPDAPPTRPGTIVYADNISGWYGALALLSALARRNETGRGAYIDLAMYEAVAFHLGPSIVRSSLNGNPAPRRGNGDEGVLVQDVFASAEQERWVAVTVYPDQRSALEHVLGTATAGDLRDALAAWLSSRGPGEAVESLQAAGLAASVANNARDLLIHPHLRARNAFSLIEHERPVEGYAAHPHAGLPWRTSGAAEPALQEAPAIGQDSCSVLKEWLGLDESAINALVKSGAVGVPPAVSPSSRGRTPAEIAQQRLAWHNIAGYDAEPEHTIALQADGTWPDRPL